MMSTDIIKYKWQDEELEISPSIIKRFIATSSNVTEQEIKDFMDLCIYQHLNPYLKEAYLVKYGMEKANIITSKDVFDKRAFRDPKYDGEEITTNYKCGMNLMELWVRTRIYHKDMSHPASDVTVYYSEYVGKKKDGSITKIWRTKPVTMLTKVSKAQAKREANPEDLARLYLSEEFDQETKPTEKVIKEIDDTEEQKLPDNKPKEEERVVNAEVVEEEKSNGITEHQDMFIKAMLLNNILTEVEKKSCKEIYDKGLTSKQAEAFINRYKELKAAREEKKVYKEDDGKTIEEYVNMIIEQKKKLYIPANMINEWAGTKKLEDLKDVPKTVLVDILDRAKKYEKTP